MTGAAVAVACGLTATSAMALVAPVTAGPPKPVKVAHLEFNGFFPSATRIHVGDSVSFAVNGFHTVTFLASGQTPPPLIVPASSNLITGKLDSSGAAFWFNGQPNLVINPAVAAPIGGNTYAGTGELSSGLPAPTGPPKPFVVTFTKAGTFTFNCLVHAGMKGVVKVLAKGTVPSVKADRLKAIAQLKAGIAEAQRLRAVTPVHATVLAGHDGNGSVSWWRFFPQTLKVKAGTSVDFKISSKREVHTITIGPVPYTSGIEETFTTPQANPAGPPSIIISPLAAYPSDPPPLPAFTGANHGNGFINAGILSNGGGGLPSNVKITFTKPGVYNYECVIHPKMDGKIIVTK
jgi:plastocyanin